VADETWAVIVEAGEVRDWQRVADPIVEAMGVPRYDAIRMSRRCTGLFACAVERGAAERAAAVLSAAGETAFAIPAAEIPDPGRANPIHNADCLPDGFRVQVDLAGKLMTLPWDEVRLLVAGVVRIEGHRVGSTTLPGMVADASISPGGGLSAAAMLIGGIAGAPKYGAFGSPFYAGPAKSYTQRMQESCAKAKKPKPTETLLAEVFTLEPTLRLRFASNAMNYDYLAERLQLSAKLNFGTFLQDIDRFSTNALISPLATRLIAGGDIRREKFQGASAWDDHCRYMLAMLVTGRI